MTDDERDSLVRGIVVIGYLLVDVGFAVLLILGLVQGIKALVGG